MPANSFSPRLAASFGTLEALTVRHCALPVRRPRDHGSGTVAGNVEVVILELRTSEGVTGWGEASPWAVFTGTAEANAAALERYIAPAVLGRPLAEVPATMAAASRAVVGHPEAKAALETALLDALGQRAGVPVWTLLGGLARERIPLSVSLADPEFAADLDLLNRVREDGVNIVKLKTGVQDHAFDLTRLERLRVDFPGLDLRVDYNQGLAPFDALRRLRDIEAFAVTFIEQPVAAMLTETMAMLATALDTPLLADESVFSSDDMLRAAQNRICDCVSVKIMKTGGLRSALDVAAIAAAAGIAGYGGDMFETGIAHLAGTHMIAAAPNISLGCEFYQASYYLEHDLLDAPFPIEQGHVVVPVAPGLGFAVDRDRLAHNTLAMREVAV
ncbi:MAG: muconate cycloisomerase [Gammaproteobacteria bacterium]|nr:muconate cycloisomerase [Gammaproteobacteria bacterium]